MRQIVSIEALRRLDREYVGTANSRKLGSAYLSEVWTELAEQYVIRGKREFCAGQLGSRDCVMTDDASTPLYVFEA